MEAFYKEVYGGGLEGAELVFLLGRAEEVLAQYERSYQVRERCEQGRRKAICAMADTLAYFQHAQNGQGGLRYAKVGSVSVSGKGVYTAVDISPAARDRELFRCAAMYLDIYRGAEGGV